MQVRMHLDNTVPILCELLVDFFILTRFAIRLEGL